MKKLHLPVPKVDKKALLISLGTTLVLLVLALGMVYQVRNERAQRAQDAAMAEKQAQATREQKVRETALQTQVQTLQADKQVICSYVRGLNTAKATRALTTLPVAAHCQ